LKTTFTMADLKPLQHLIRERKIYAVNNINKIFFSPWVSLVHLHQGTVNARINSTRRILSELKYSAVIPPSERNLVVVPLPK